MFYLFYLSVGALRCTVLYISDVLFVLRARLNILINKNLTEITEFHEARTANFSWHVFHCLGTNVPAGTLK